MKTTFSRAFFPAALVLLSALLLVGTFLRASVNTYLTNQTIASLEADASAIAALLNGGGHARAAGCSVKGDLLFARQAVLSAIAQQMGWEEEKVD